MRVIFVLCTHVMLSDCSDQRKQNEMRDRWTTKGPNQNISGRDRLNDEDGQPLAVVSGGLRDKALTPNDLIVYYSPLPQRGFE